MIISPALKDFSSDFPSSECLVSCPPPAQRLLAVDVNKQKIKALRSELNTALLSLLNANVRLKIKSQVLPKNFNQIKPKGDLKELIVADYTH
jgi:hypothetical protein